MTHSTSPQDRSTQDSLVHGFTSGLAAQAARSSV